MIRFSSILIDPKSNRFLIHKASGLSSILKIIEIVGELVLPSFGIIILPSASISPAK